MNALDVWRRVTARTTCNLTDCARCRQIYRIVSCPLDIEINKDELKDLIMKITILLDGITSNGKIDITEEEFTSIFSDYCGE